MKIREYIKHMELKDPIEWDNPTAIPQSISAPDKYGEIYRNSDASIWVAFRGSDRFILLKKGMASLFAKTDSEIDDSYLA